MHFYGTRWNWLLLTKRSRGNKAIALSEEHKVEKERARLEKDGVELNPHQSRINGINNYSSF